MSTKINYKSLPWTQNMTERVYIVNEINGNHNTYKIGHSTNVKHRLAKLRSDNPHQIELIGSIPGNCAIEQLLMSCMGQWHRKGEWFFTPKACKTFVKDILKAQTNEQVINKLFKTCYAKGVNVYGKLPKHVYFQKSPRTQCEAAIIGRHEKK